MGSKVDHEACLTVLNKPEYMVLLLAIASGHDYATTIAKLLDKKQPTITRELSILEDIGLISVASRGKAKRYTINFDLFYDVLLYSIKLDLQNIKRIRKESYELSGIQFVDKIRDLHRAMPKRFLVDWFKEYSGALFELGGRIKNLSELIYGLFGSILELSENELKSLQEKYKLDLKLLIDIAHEIHVETFIVELVALDMLIS